MKRYFIAIVLVIGILSTGFSKNELQRADFSAKYSVLNSSAFVDETASILINPAGLGRISRMSLSFDAPDFQNIGFFGLSGIMPWVGGSFAIATYNIPVTNSSMADYSYYNSVLKRGMALGWGKEITGSVAFGFAAKTISRDMGDVSDGLGLDAGLIFFPNETMGKFFRNEWINNKIFFSVVVQNLGKSPAKTEREDINFRTGFGYIISPLWTKIFVEKNFLSENGNLIVGAEIHPDVKFLSMFSLRASYDMKDVRVGFGINGKDANADFSYNLNTKQVMLSFNGYFESTREEQSVRAYEEGMIIYSEALEMERDGRKEMYAKFHAALNRFSDAVKLNKNNSRADDRKSQVESKLESYQSDAIDNAEDSESQRDYVSAIVYYNQADMITPNSAARQKASSLLTNESVKKYLKNKKTVVAGLIKKGRYFNASKENEGILAVNPNDPDGRSYNDQIRGRLNDTAEKIYQKGRTYYEKGNYEGAITQARFALRYNPDHDRARNLISQASSKLASRKGYEQAVAQYQQKNHMGAIRILNYLLNKNPRQNNALRLKNQIIAELKDNVKANLDNGIAYYNNNEYDKAINEFDKVLLAEPKNSIASDYRNRAASKMKAIEKLGDIEEE